MKRKLIKHLEAIEIASIEKEAMNKWNLGIDKMKTADNYLNKKIKKLTAEEKEIWHNKVNTAISYYEESSSLYKKLRRGVIHKYKRKYATQIRACERQIKKTKEAFENFENKIIESRGFYQNIKHSPTLFQNKNISTFSQEKRVIELKDLVIMDVQTSRRQTYLIWHTVAGRDFNNPSTPLPESEENNIRLFYIDMENGKWPLNLPSDSFLINKADTPIINQFWKRILNFDHCNNSDLLEARKINLLTFAKLRLIKKSEEKEMLETAETIASLFSMRK